ncbi:PhnE/PtxC family ABC transporter permease [Pseudomaricurvus alkylphenolicus]|uniref:PhnE/PtxC family ABC transporter permease n=1 Tax=Pseudomaricurvus alkylphenolicus TaxID=1306991 RepID=UPI001F10A2BB|nr:ABC transporter permease [Pseudomaricurvus alkylphenolicus]
MSISSAHEFHYRTALGPLSRTAALLTLVGVMALLLADIEIISPEPGLELTRMGLGLLSPRIPDQYVFVEALLNTLSFAFQAMALATLIGFLLSLVYRLAVVRAFCAFIRGIHELFWALIFLQVMGLSTLTGVLALAIPYAGILAKIFGELFEEVSPQPRNNLLVADHISAFFYTTLPLAWRSLCAYCSYRFECMVRSSVILGFVGLPTLGFYLESALREGRYQEGAALLYVLLLLIATLRFWLRRALLPVYLLAAFLLLPPVVEVSWDGAWRFFTVDIVPAPLRNNSQAQLWSWLTLLWQQQLQPGVINTLILGMAALLVTAMFALLCFPLNSPHFVRGWSRRFGDAFLIIGRTLPEYLLAFVGLIVLGPSMLPALLALALHNGTIVAHLVGRFSESLSLRQDAVRGVNLYFYEVLPRMFRQFLALLLYRWEVIMRESAILGMLGFATLGFYIDSAFEEFRFDRAALLIICSALLNMLADALARYWRRRLHLNTTPETL